MAEYRSDQSFDSSDSEHSESLHSNDEEYDVAVQPHGYQFEPLKRDGIGSNAGRADVPPPRPDRVGKPVTDWYDEIDIHS